MGHPQEPGGFHRGTVLGCHLCNKSSREMSKYSTVNCQLYFKKMEEYGNNSNSATKWKAT